jgi:hypothetical protein
VEFPLSQALNFVHNALPFLPHHFSKALQARGIKSVSISPHSFMPPIQGLEFAAVAPGNPSATVDLTEGSQKRGPQESVTDHSKSNKKQRGPWKITEIIELDDAKEDVELLTNVGHWKDHM